MTKFLIDTNVMSELMKPRPNPGVLRFFDSVRQRGEKIYLSVITLGEIRKGAMQLRVRGKMETALQVEAWLELCLRDFEGSILNIDHYVADIWGALCATHPGAVVDKQIAATAMTHRLVLVTRNTRDFEQIGVEMLNPFVG